MNSQIGFAKPNSWNNCFSYFLLKIYKCFNYSLASVRTVFVDKHSEKAVSKEEENAP